MFKLPVTILFTVICLHQNISSATSKVVYTNEKIDMLKEVLERLPNNVEAHFELGFLYYKEKRRFDDAIAEWEKVLRLDTKFGKAYFHLAWALFFQKNDLVNAEKRALQALDIAELTGQANEYWYQDTMWLLEMIHSERGDLNKAFQYQNKRKNKNHQGSGAVPPQKVRKKISEELKNMYDKKKYF